MPLVSPSASSSFLLVTQSEGLHFLYVLLSVILVQSKRLLLGRTLYVRLIFQQFLYSQQYLLDCNVWLPILLFIQY